MDAVAGTPYRKRQRRKKGEGKKAAQDLSVVRDRAQHLCQLLSTAREASTDYRDAVKAVAEKAGVDAPVLRAYIKARQGDEYSKHKARVEQLTLLFDNVGGEVSGGTH